MSGTSMSDGDVPSARNIILIGCRGCGKSSVGRVLADRLGWAFVDTDERVEALAGRSIAETFRAEGEPAFRALETEVIAKVARDEQQVIGVGGGAVLAESNRAALRRAGVCVWLAAPAEVLHRRVRDDLRSATTRPPLTGRGALDEIRHLLEQREPLYAVLAQHVVETTGRSVVQVADEVLALLRQCNKPPESR